MGCAHSALQDSLSLLTAALSSLPNSPFPLHAAFLALGDIPSSLPELSEDATISHLLSKTPQQIILGLSGLELHAHMYVLTTSLCWLPGEYAETNTSPSREPAGTKKNLGCYPTQTQRGQQPRSITPQTIPCIGGETISLSALVKPHPMNNDNTSRGNCQVAGR